MINDIPEEHLESGYLVYNDLEHISIFEDGSEGMDSNL